MTTDNRSFSDDTSFPAVSTAALLFVAATELAAGTLTIEPAPCPACSASVSAPSEGLGRVTMHGASGPVYEAAEEDRAVGHRIRKKRRFARQQRRSRLIPVFRRACSL